MAVRRVGGIGDRVVSEDRVSRVNTAAAFRGIPITARDVWTDTYRGGGGRGTRACLRSRVAMPAVAAPHGLHPGGACANGERCAAALRSASRRNTEARWRRCSGHPSLEDTSETSRNRCIPGFQRRPAAPWEGREVSELPAASMAV